MSYISYQDWWG